MMQPRHGGFEHGHPSTYGPGQEDADVDRPPRRRTDERAEGVISTAIAVLIMAFIGAAMWGVFNGVFTDAGATIEQQVSEIGS